MTDEKPVREYRIEVERKRPLVYIAFCVIHAVTCKLERIRDNIPSYMEWKTVTVRGDIRRRP